MNRKLFALITAVLLLISMAAPALADVIPYGSTVYAGELYIVSSMDCQSSSGSASILGHENHTSLSQTFGRMVVPAGEQITIGTTDMEDFKGVWCNLEAYNHEIKDEFVENVYHNTSLYIQDLVAIANVIDNWEDYDLYTNNCVHFSTAVWNAVSDTKFEGNMPSGLGVQIQRVSSNTNLVLEDQELIGYFDEFGEFEDCYNN